MYSHSFARWSSDTSAPLVVQVVARAAKSSTRVSSSCFKAPDLSSRAQLKTLDHNKQNIMLCMSRLLLPFEATPAAQPLCDTRSEEAYHFGSSSPTI